MASAIALTYTRDGFVMAADGRMRQNKIVISENAQKIFSIAPNKEISLAYALGGSVFLTDKANDNVIVVNLQQRAGVAVAALSPVDHDGLTSYVRALCMFLYRAILEGQNTGMMELLPVKLRRGGNFDICYLFVAGYYRGQPGWRFAVFSHNDQKLLTPELHDHILTKGPLIYGSEIIKRKLFDNDDSKVSPYRVPGFQQSECPTLSDGIEAMKNYIRACSDPRVAAFDREICNAIGGHLHIATVTSKGGFSWACPPV